MDEKNIYQKLMQARIDFSKKKIEPSGYNGHLNFDYLELKDIVPVANKIMQDNGIMLITTFNQFGCQGHVVDIENPDSRDIIFAIYYEKKSEGDPRSKGSSPIQICGGDITYLRRYMYQIVLDIVINDEVDADDDEKPIVKPAVTATPIEKKEETSTKVKKSKPTVKAVSEPKAPVTAEKRAEIKAELTTGNGKADKLQVDKLKAIAIRWVNVIPSDKETATALMVKTNGFTDMSRKEADELIDFIEKKISTVEEK